MADDNEHGKGTISPCYNLPQLANNSEFDPDTNAETQAKTRSNQRPRISWLETWDLHNSTIRGTNFVQGLTYARS